MCVQGACVLCSDITNKQVGISGETVPEAGNLCIYCVHLVSGSSNIWVRYEGDPQSPVRRQF